MAEQKENYAIEVMGTARLSESYLNQRDIGYSLIMRVDIDAGNRETEPTRRKITVPITKKQYDELKQKVSGDAGESAIHIAGKLEIKISEIDKDNDPTLF